MELKIDVMDALQLEKYENALNNIKNAPTPTGNASGVIKAQCQLVRKFYDDIFGENTGNEMFGDTWNFRDHYEALKGFITQTNEQVAAENAEMLRESPDTLLNRA